MKHTTQHRGIQSKLALTVGQPIFIRVRIRVRVRVRIRVAIFLEMRRAHF